MNKFNLGDRVKLVKSTYLSLDLSAFTPAILVAVNTDYREVVLGWKADEFKVNCMYLMTEYMRGVFNKHYTCAKDINDFSYFFISNLDSIEHVPA